MTPTHPGVKMQKEFLPGIGSISENGSQFLESKRNFSSNDLIRNP